MCIRDSISTPHNTHIQYLREALKHGKHVLCEKSITLNAKELEEAKQLAEENGVVLAEAMTIYHMPLYKKLQEVIRSGKLGKLCMAQMNFGSYKEYDMQNRFFNPNLAGGNPAYESGRRDGYDSAYSACKTAEEGNACI